MSRDETSVWVDEAEEKLDELKGKAADRLGVLKDYAADFDERARSFIAERPIVSLVAAVGLGFLIGKLITRR